MCLDERGFIHVDACLSVVPYTNSSVLSPAKNVKNKHLYILAARCCWFQGRHKESNSLFQLNESGA